MANEILTPSIIAKEALMVLRNNAVMASLVHRDYSNEFVNAVGDTITVRKPATFEAKEFENEIEIQDAKEEGVPVVMDKHLDVSFATTSKEMTLDIADFSEQFLVPAMQAFADKIDGYILDLNEEVTSRENQTDDAWADMVAIRKHLTENAAPLTQRSFVYNSDTEAKMLNTDLFVSVGEVGDTDGLREASLGRKFGLDCFCDQNCDNTDGLAGIAFHRNAFALVTRPLALPNGSANAATVNYDGFGLRVVYGYDMNAKTDTISIDMLCGVKTLDERLASVLQAAA